MEIISKKCQILFFGENKKTTIKFSSAELAESGKVKPK